MLSKFALNTKMLTLGFLVKQVSLSNRFLDFSVSNYKDPSFKYQKSYENRHQLNKLGTIRTQVTPKYQKNITTYL